jgi:hypothetical protein
MDKLINWSALSEHLTGNKGNIRPNRIPEKYQEEVSLLQYYVNSWADCRELEERQQVEKQVRQELSQQISQILDK